MFASIHPTAVWP